MSYWALGLLSVGWDQRRCLVLFDHVFSCDICRVVLVVSPVTMMLISQLVQGKEQSAQ